MRHIMCTCTPNKITHRGCEPLLKDLQEIAKVIESPQWDDSDEQNQNDESNSENHYHEPVKNPCCRKYTIWWECMTEMKYTTQTSRLLCCSPSTPTMFLSYTWQTTCLPVSLFKKVVWTVVWFKWLKCSSYSFFQQFQESWDCIHTQMIKSLSGHETKTGHMHP